MSSKPYFPPLENWEPTHKSLHAYSLAVGVIPRAHAVAHPKWWHISLKVRPDGLVTDSIPLPGGGVCALRMDLHQHQVILATSHADTREFSLTEGLTGTQFGDQLIAAVADLGLTGEYAREKFESDEPREYDPAVAENFFTALVNADRAFKQHRANLNGDTGPVQLWPHGFDLAFEWFGTRVETYEEHGKVMSFPAQLNFGFSPGEPKNPFPYFYSNPWPFEKDQLVDKPLPSGATWFLESFQGTMLKYEALVNDEAAEQKLLAYLRAVYEISSPTLMA